MMTYFGSGVREFGKYPFTPCIRKSWEFWSVLSGQAGVLLPSGADFFRSRTLWLFPPLHEHGWIGDPDEPAEVAVFHFSFVPPPVESLCRGAKEKFIEIQLNSDQISRVKNLVEQTKKIKQSSPSTLLCHQHTLLELSLFVLRFYEQKEDFSYADRKHEYAQKALIWYDENMADNPSQDDIARNAAISKAHLRRVFHELYNCSPRRMMEQLKFDRATNLMADPEVKLLEVADACGYQDVSSFSHAFKKHFGCCPNVWRQNHLFLS
jgi:AraC-like DNA-binding protein